MPQLYSISPATLDAAKLTAYRVGFKDGSGDRAYNIARNAPSPFLRDAYERGYMDGWKAIQDAVRAEAKRQDIRIEIRTTGRLTWAA